MIYQQNTIQTFTVQSFRTASLLGSTQGSVHNIGSSPQITPCATFNPVFQFPSSFSVVSNSPQDTVNGQGVREIVVEGLREIHYTQYTSHPKLWQYAAETIQLNGTTPVSSSFNNWVKFFRFTPRRMGNNWDGISSPGSIISLQVGGVLYLQLQGSFLTPQNGLGGLSPYFCVPDGYSAKVSNFNVTVGRSTAQNIHVALVYRDWLGNANGTLQNPAAWRPLKIVSTQSVISETYPLPTDIRIDSRGEIDVRYLLTGPFNTTDLVVSYDVTLFPDLNDDFITY